MNLSSLILAFIPLVNLIIPFVFWKKNKEIQSRNNIASRMLSFQLLWSIVTIIGMGIALFLSNIAFGGAGNGLFISIIFYLLAVLFNIFMIAKTASQLNNKNENTLSFMPSLF